MSDQKKPETPSNSNEDKELAELLDSALEDFSKSAAKEADAQNEKKKLKEDAGLGTDDLSEADWTEDFISQAAAQFESNIGKLLLQQGGDDLTPDQLQQGFQRLAEAANQAVSSPAETLEAPKDFAATISQTLQGLSEGAETVQNIFTESDIMKMFGQQPGDPNALVPFMQGMMESLLSKEVLYPSLKDILDKYPAWLEANGGSLPREELQKYEKQQILMREVCAQLETESEADSPSQKKEHFEKVLALMQKLQDCGQPPSEIVGDVGPGLQLGGMGNPDLNQCCMM